MSIATTYTVSGMTCEHCVRAVASEVGSLPEVVDTQIDLTSGRLDVTSSAPLALGDVQAAVEEAGYTVLAAG